MRTDWYKGIDPNLEKLTELLSMSKPSHGYTIAESAPEIVTAPGVYFPARKGEVIPLESRQAGGNVNPTMNPTANGMMSNTEDGKMKILQSALKSIDKIISSVSPKPMQLESRQGGGEVNPDWETRASGTPKGKGYFGILQRPNGGVSTELSAGVNFGNEEIEIPTLVPTLTQEEVDYLLAGGKPTKEIMDKAFEHAKQRIFQGRNPFAQEGEQKPLIFPPQGNTPLESRQEGGGVTSLLDRMEKDPNVFTETSSVGAPNPEGDIQAGRSLDALSNAMRESNLAILQPQTMQTSTDESNRPLSGMSEYEENARRTRLGLPPAFSIPKLPSPPTPRSYGIQPEATKLGGSDLLWQEQNEKRKKRIPLFSAQEGAVTVPTEEDEYEKMRRLLGLGASAPVTLGPPELEGDRLARERLGSTLNVSDVGKEMKYWEDVAKARTGQAEYDRYMADKELRQAAGLTPREGMVEYEHGAKQMRMTRGEKYASTVAEGKLAEQYITNKGLLDVARAKPTTPPAPHLVQNEKGEYVWATPGGVLPAGIMGKPTPRAVSTEELVRGDLKRKLGREASEGEILNEIDRRKLNVQMGGIPPLSPETQTVPKVKGVKNDAALEGLTEDQKGIIRGLTNYNYPWPGSFAMRDPKWVALMGRAEKYDPEFNAAEYQVRYNLRKSFTSGKDKDNLLALNTAIGHIDSLVKAKDELANSNWPTANAATNLLAKYFPVSEGLVKRQGTITGVKTKFNAVAGEMANIFKRSGATDQEIKSWKSTITDPSTATPAMWDAFINGSLELMGSRISALKDRYESGLGKAKDFGFLSDTSRGILQGLGVDVDAIDPPPVGQKTVIKQFVSPSAGKTKYIYSDGTEEIK